ncbi:MAG: Hsp20/alpha crystallin family protein [Calditrichia bacterium]
MALVSWRPTRYLMDFENEVSRLINSFFASEDSTDGEVKQSIEWYPRVDIRESKDEFILTAEIPGVEKEDIEVVLKDDVLTISGERKKEKEEKDVNYHRVERNYGKFCRSFRIPAQIQQEKISASYKNGILELHLPKAEEVKPKSIEVKVA